MPIDERIENWADRLEKRTESFFSRKRVRIIGSTISLIFEIFLLFISFHLRRKGMLVLSRVIFIIGAIGLLIDIIIFLVSRKR